MKAMVLKAARHELQYVDVAEPKPDSNQVLIRVSACGVCRTDLHIADGELLQAKWPLIPGHEVVGRVVEVGNQAAKFAIGDRVGVPWLAATCGGCRYCKAGSENLCDRPKFTGYTVDGGYAEYLCANEDFCCLLPADYADAEAAPLLCAGLIGYRSLRMAGNSNQIGIYGFGAAAHIITQVAKFQGREVFAFIRPGDDDAAELAIRCGAVWAGDSTKSPPVELDAAIIFAPVGALVPLALKAVRKAGTVICGGIHMSEIPAFPYELLWGERTIRSVANLVRQDATEFFNIAKHVRIRTETTVFPLAEANQALELLRNGQIRGAAVLKPPG